MVLHKVSLVNSLIPAPDNAGTVPNMIYFNFNELSEASANETVRFSDGRLWNKGSEHATEAGGRKSKN